MDTLDPVVVGVDGPAQGMGALRWAADEAAWRKRPLRILCAIGSLDPQSYRSAQRLIDDAVARARAWQPRVEVVGCVRYGTPTAELCAESEHAALIVVGSRGRGGVAGLLLGSVCAQVAAHARSAVLVVHNAQTWAGTGAPPSSQLPVVVGLDGSSGSDLAAGAAFEAAAARTAALVAVRAWRAPQPTWPRDVGPLAIDVVEMETAERRLLTESVARWRARYPQVPVRLRLIAGSAGSALVAASTDTRLAIVGARGRDGFAGLLLGSASQQLLHHAQCPVLVARKTIAAPTGEVTPAGEATALAGPRAGRQIAATTGEPAVAGGARLGGGH
jgi:nucleotide-binding universal stress UspA family protein